MFKIVVSATCFVTNDFRYNLTWSSTASMSKKNSGAFYNFSGAHFAMLELIFFSRFYGCDVKSALISYSFNLQARYRISDDIVNACQEPNIRGELADVFSLENRPVSVSKMKTVVCGR